MTPPRPKKEPQDLEAIGLVGEDSFIDAMRALLRADRHRVNELVEEERARERNEDAPVE